MDLSNQCNLRCRMCYFSLDSKKDEVKTFMPTQLFERIITQVGPISTQVCLSCGAEPLVHPQFKEILAIARKHVSEIWFVTNGSLFDEEIARLCVELQINRIAFSFEGATKETYEWIRRGASFDTFVKNVSTLAKIKKQTKSKLPLVTGNVVLMKKNIRELPEIVRLAKKIGILSLSAEYMRIFNGLQISEESLENEPNLTKKYISVAKETAREMGILFSPPQDLTEKKYDPLTICRRPWEFINVWPTGEVIPCESWYGEKPIGDLSRQTFDEMWGSVAYRDLRRAIETKEGLLPCCASCHGFLSREVGKDVFKKITFFKK